MTYRAPVQDLEYLLENVIGFSQVAETERFAEATPDMCAAILSEAAKLSDEVLAPLRRAGDLHPAHLENGVVRTSPGFAEGYRAIAEGGWIGMSADPEYGGMGLPLTLLTALNDMMNGGCLALSLNPLMTQGQIEALEHHATDEIKATYLPKLISGEWCGTMNLTEPQAGSDVGALSSKAVPNPDGSYAVTGQKIFITWGDNDFSENVCHLVLARLPDGSAGTKGISLFIVPKYIPDADGYPGKANSLGVVSLEHKLGLHGSPTAVMSFDSATGWLVGEEHGGIKAMFTMMNNARLGVGTEGLGTAEAAYQLALEYAKDRKQGRSPVQDGTGTILDHADVRHMLMTMKSQTAAARAIVYATAMSTDMATALGDPTWRARAALLTPVAKAFGTDTGIEVASLGIQVHGGMGFIEETGAAQFYRDARVTTIYEGTNGIQAMDLVGRKLMDGGAAMFAMLDEIRGSANGPHAEAILAAEGVFRKTTDWMLAQENLNERFAGSTRYLRAFAYLLGAHFLNRAGQASAATNSHCAVAAFFVRNMLVQLESLCSMSREGSEDLYALSADEL